VVNLKQKNVGWNTRLCYLSGVWFSEVTDSPCLLIAIEI
jgi:hypothetical protein